MKFLVAFKKHQPAGVLIAEYDSRQRRRIEGGHLQPVEAFSGTHRHSLSQRHDTQQGHRGAPNRNRGRTRSCTFCAPFNDTRSREAQGPCEFAVRSRHRMGNRGSRGRSRKLDNPHFSIPELFAVEADTLWLARATCCSLELSASWQAS